MSSPRSTPFDLVFGDTARRIFPDISTALSQSGAEPRDRDAFLMVREVVTLLRELRPEEGLGEAIDQLANEGAYRRLECCYRTRREQSRRELAQLVVAGVVHDDDVGMRRP